MKVTVCEVNNAPDELARDWAGLVAHVKAEGSDLVLLPEMPFYPWLARTRDVDLAAWQAAVEAHEAWLARFEALAPAIVLGSRPVSKNGLRLNEGFVWETGSGYRAAHAKYYLPDEAGFWEASWYDRGEKEFTAIQTNQARLGFLICTELWFTEHARAYARQGIHLLASPRATEQATVDKWLMGGRAAAVMSGAFSLSSNPVHPRQRGADLGGQGWVVGPDGQVLALTSAAQPFITVEVDLRQAERAKQTYPRYVLE